MANSNSTQKKGWGGDWTEVKLNCFEKYVPAYLTIMNAKMKDGTPRRDKNRWKLVYFDGFAGCGERTPQPDEKRVMDSLFGDDMLFGAQTEDYRGAAERVVQLETKTRGFDYYYFIDKYEENLTRLENRLAKYKTKGAKVFRTDIANNELKKLSMGMKDNPNLRVLCLLDPFGMHIDMSALAALAGPAIDLWILVPTGSIINRLICNNGTLRYPKTLEQFFGLPASAIKERFFREELVPANLFEEEHIEVRKVNNIIDEIINLYVEQLGSLFQRATMQPLVMRNSKGLPIFHFVCVSNNPTAVRIAQDIIKKAQN